MTRPVKRYVDNWKFWITAFGVGLAAVVVAVVFVLVRQSNADQARRATMRAANIAQVAGCYISVKNAPVTDGLVTFLYVVANNSIDNSRQAIKEHPHDPLNSIRRTSISKMSAGRTNLDALSEIIAGNTPTIPKCRTLARKLTVDYRPYEKELNS